MFPRADSGAGRRSDWLRVALIPLFVLACYQFSWQGWRGFNCWAYLGISRALGVPGQRIALDAYLSLGQAYRYTIGCTAIDGFLGSIPLLWERGQSIARNSALLAMLFVALFAANIGKNALGMVIFMRGAPWWLSHDVPAGILYFFFVLWIIRRRGWPLVLPFEL